MSMHCKYSIRPIWTWHWARKMHRNCKYLHKITNTKMKEKNTSMYFLYLLICYGIARCRCRKWCIMWNYHRYLSEKPKNTIHIHITKFTCEKREKNGHPSAKTTTVLKINWYYQSSHRFSSICSIDSAEIQINRQHCLNSNTLSMHLASSRTVHCVIFINLFFDWNTHLFRPYKKFSRVVVSTSHDIAHSERCFHFR